MHTQASENTGLRLGRLLQLLLKSILFCLAALLTLILGFSLSEVLLWRQLWARRARGITTVNGRWSRAVIYLSGISHFAKSDLLPHQPGMLRQAAQLVRAERITSITFPYERVTPQQFAPFDLWRRLGYSETPSFAYPLRNFWQVTLSSSFPRWYGRPVARCIANHLGEAHEDALLVVIGNSTGASLILSAAPFLRQRWPTLRIVAITCGGVYGANPGLDQVAEFHQLVGSRDSVALKVGELLPGRRWRTRSIGRALRQGRYHETIIGEQGHAGRDGYFGDRYHQATTNAILGILGKYESANHLA
jgi:hypothetical protein